MKVNKKKALALIVAASMALTGSACSINKKEESSSGKIEYEQEETSSEEIKYEQAIIEDDYTAYIYKPEIIIEEIVKLARYDEYAGYKAIDFGYIIEDGKVYINDDAMGITRFEGESIYMDLASTDYQKLVDYIFELDADLINITPFYSAMKHESGYSIIILGLNESKTNMYDGTLHKEEDLEYVIEDGLAIGMGEVSEERAKELFIEYLKTYMEFVFGAEQTPEVVKTENNGIKLLLVKKESEAL